MTLQELEPNYNMGNTEQLTEKEFLQFHSGYYGEGIDNIKQIGKSSFNGEELLEYLQSFLRFNQKSEPEEKRLSAEAYIRETMKNDGEGGSFISIKYASKVAESFAYIRVEQAEQNLKKEILENILISLSEQLPEDCSASMDQKIRSIVKSSINLPKA